MTEDDGAAGSDVDEAVSERVDYDSDPVVTDRRGFIVASTVAMSLVSSATLTWLMGREDEEEATQGRTTDAGREPTAGAEGESTAGAEGESTAPEGPADEPLRVYRSAEREGLDYFSIDTPGEAPYADKIDAVRVGADAHETYDLWEDEQLVVSGTEDHANELVEEMDEDEQERTELVIPRDEGEEHPTFEIEDVDWIYDLRRGEGAAYWPHRSKRLNSAEIEEAKAENPTGGLGEFLGDLVSNPGEAVRKLGDTIGHLFTDNTSVAGVAAVGAAAAEKRREGQDGSAVEADRTPDDSGVEEGGEETTGSVLDAAVERQGGESELGVSGDSRQSSNDLSQ